MVQIGLLRHKKLIFFLVKIAKWFWSCTSRVVVYLKTLLGGV
jgi:hypothetical protein